MTTMTHTPPTELTLTRPRPRRTPGVGGAPPPEAVYAPSSPQGVATPHSGHGAPSSDREALHADHEAPHSDHAARRSDHAAPQANRETPRTPNAAKAAASGSHGSGLDAAAASLAVAIIEIFGGTRAPSSVGRWVTPELFERIRAHASRRAQLAKAAPPRPMLVTAGKPRVCLIGPHVAEAAVVVSTGRRHRAVAMRFEQRRNRWLLTQLETA